jgi:hypothetical protein
LAYPENMKERVCSFPESNYENNYGRFLGCLKNKNSRINRMIHVLNSLDLASLEKAWMIVSIAKLKRVATINNSTYPPAFLT